MTNSYRLGIIVILASIAVGFWVGTNYRRSSYISYTPEEVPNNIPQFELPIEVTEESFIESFEKASNTQEVVKPIEYKTEKYVEIINSCNFGFGGACVNLRTGPSTSYPTAMALRDGVVLKVRDTVENQGITWYKVVFEEWVRYPDRLGKSLYVASDFVREIEVTSPVEDVFPATTTKRIIVDRSEQMMYAYDGDELFMKEKVSTGKKTTPTPRGNFKIFKKMPSRYMQGPLPGISEQEYDLPGVPWTMYFTKEGGAIHGAYWHNKFGQSWSNGCVNLPVDKSEEIYKWADLGTPVIVRD